MNRIVISGATGAIGMALIRYSLERNIQVLAICHRGSGRIARLPKADNLQIIELSAEEYGDFIRNAEGYQCLANMMLFFIWHGKERPVQRGMI